MEKNEILIAALKEVVGLSFRSKITITLDENIECLTAGLKQAGFKVYNVEKGWSDDRMKDYIGNTVLITKNAKDFIDDATKYDYDIIDIKNIKYLDNDPTEKNKTVQKIKNVCRKTQFYKLRGVFLVTIHDDGSYAIEDLI
jgi:hypothetical protein